MTLAAQKLPNYQLDPPEEKKTVADLWGEIRDIAENIALYASCHQPTLQWVNTVKYEAEELNEKIRLLKEGI